MDQAAAGGRPRVHSSLEHTFKGRGKRTAEPGGGEVLSCTITYRYPHPTPAAKGGERQLLLSLLSTARDVFTVDQKSLGAKDGDATKGLLMEVGCLCTASVFTAVLGPASEQLRLA